MWYISSIPPTIVYILTVGVDFTIRRSNTKNYSSTPISLIDYCMVLSVLRIFDIHDCTALLECIFGPAENWPRAIIPILPGLLLADGGGHMNGLIPEGKNGIKTAVYIQAGVTFLPCEVQWVAWIFGAATDLQYPLITAEWVLSTVAWIYLDTPPQVAYGLYLIVS
jgi:hypothetical protein